MATGIARRGLRQLVHLVPVAKALFHVELETPLRRAFVPLRGLQRFASLLVMVGE